MKTEGQGEERAVHHRYLMIYLIRINCDESAANLWLVY